MVRAIRGATTVESNNKSEILQETKSLLEKIVSMNQLVEDDIISVIFSVTKDLDAAFPAVAARQIGWTDLALMCTNEISVPGSLEKCIRVLIHINTEKSNSEIKHVYIKNAVSLRPDLGPKKKTIAIDGPAGSGKSTIAKILSKTLGIIYLDTGAMYRTAAFKAMKEGIDLKDKEKIAELMQDIDIKIVYQNNEQQIFLDGENVGNQIRTPEISLGASEVAVVPAVRIKMVEIQREIAKNNSVVMDGRDIGTYVLPDADLKIFLIASVDERALRRYNELNKSGNTNISLDEVKKDISYRDVNDSTREFAPLKKAEDAIEIDTSKLSIQEVTNKVLEYINK